MKDVFEPDETEQFPAEEDPIGDIARELPTSIWYRLARRFWGYTEEWGETDTSSYKDIL